MNIKELFRISYEKQIVYFVILLIIFFGFTEIISLTFTKRMEQKWLFSKETELSIFKKETDKIVGRPREEMESRLSKLVDESSLKRIVISDKKGKILFDTSPFAEEIEKPEVKKHETLKIDRRKGYIVTSLWYRFSSQKGDYHYLGLFSSEEEMPFYLRFLLINSYIKLTGTVISLVLGIYFILFILSPFRRMGKIAKGIKDREVSSVDDIIKTFSETTKELRTLLEKEKRKVLRMEREISIKEHLASLGEMSAGIAHEFKNALGTISGFTKLAKRKEDKREYLEKIEKEADALNKVVNEFLLFAKPQEPEKEYFSLIDIVTELMERKPEKIEVKLDIEEKENIYADRVLLKRAFSNILSNAYESMENGGTLTIKSKRNKGKGLIKLQFIDEGCGIPSELQKEVFTPFYSSKADGVGLGLSIVYKIVSLHNGSVSIKSTDKGTIVEVELPVQQKHKGKQPVNVEHSGKNNV
jgi:signal transduction histidine kinase